MQPDPIFLLWLTAVGGISTAAAALGTLCTLVFMYLQLRQMAEQTKSLGKSIKSATYQAIVDSEMDLWQAATATPQIVNAAYAEELHLEDDVIKSIMIGLSFYENLFYQNEQGTFPKDMWPHWERAIRDVACTPYYLRAWKVMRPYYYAPFVELMDTAIHEFQNGKDQNESCDVLNVTTDTAK